MPVQVTEPEGPIGEIRIECTRGQQRVVVAWPTPAPTGVSIVRPLIQSAKLNGHDPYEYIRDILLRLPTQPDSRIDEFLPHNWKPEIAGAPGTEPTDQLSNPNHVAGYKQGGFAVRLPRADIKVTA